MQSSKRLCTRTIYISPSLWRSALSFLCAQDLQIVKSVDRMMLRESTSTKIWVPFWRQRLLARGAVCVPMCWARPAQLSAEFDRTVAAFPECKTLLPQTYRYQHNGQTKCVATQWVGGGFGALGLPSSQHNMFVRQIRQWVLASLAPLFTSVIDTLSDGDWKLEKTFDRMLIRSVDQTPTAESLHRDECPNALPTDVLFGGWFNLSTEPQSFTFCPGSHRGSADGKTSGFTKIKKGSDEYKTLMPQLRTVRVQPGEVLLFYENVAHIVAPTPTARKMRRAFLGWRLTCGTAPLVEDVIDRIRRQAIVPLKSNQTPNMYPNMWRATAMDRLEKWSAAMFDPRLLETVTVQSGKSEGKVFQAVPQVLKSLKYYARKFPDKVWMQPKYSKQERAMYVPGQSWNLLVPGSATEFVVVSL